VDEVHSVFAKYKDRVDFLTIYLREAHAQDIWPLGQHVVVTSHKCIDDRIAVANEFIKANSWRLPTVVDTMEDCFMHTYWAHPERFFVLLNGKLAFKAQPRDAYYPVSDLVQWLTSHFS